MAVERTSRAHLAVVTFVVLACLGATAAWASRDPAPATTDGVQIGLAAADLATSTLPPPTTSPPPSLSVQTAPATTLPLPEPLPANPYAPTPAVELGRLRIPKLGVDEPMQSGMTLTAINRGPGHWPGTAMPGQLGNMVVAGHRTTYSKPFERLEQLVAGDRVEFAMPDGTHTYEVRGVIVVPENHIGIAAATPAHTATLFACHPKGSATHRIVAKLKLLGPDGSPVDDEATLPPVDAGADATGTTLVVRQEPGAPPAASDPFAGTNG